MYYSSDSAIMKRFMRINLIFKQIKVGGHWLNHLYGILAQYTEFQVSKLQIKSREARTSSEST